MFVASTHLQHVLLAGFLLGGPAQRRPPQVHRELWDNLIGLGLSGEKKASASTFSVKLIHQAPRDSRLFERSRSTDWLLVTVVYFVRSQPVFVLSSLVSPQDLINLVLLQPPVSQTQWAGQSNEAAFT